jgi:hypothetical protein
MSNVYTGGCACGALRYKITGEPVAMVDCQCRQCQRASGTGHSSHVAFHGAAVDLAGSASLWTATGDGGTAKHNGFCPTCGAPVYMAFPDKPELFTVRAASLDEPARYRPQVVTWTAAGQAWDRLDPTLPTFAQMPPQE